MVREKLGTDSTGHDWWHTYRVWRMSVRIAMEERKGDLCVVQLAALLHDVEDWKFTGDDLSGYRFALEWLSKIGVDPDRRAKIAEIVRDLSFKGARVREPKLSIEGQIVQDADRLDALGAIGIARCFATGGYLNRPIYDPAESPVLHSTPGAYRASKSSSIMHFYEKLLLLKDRLHTETARKIAERRHRFMEEFIDRFFSEWNMEPDINLMIIKDQDEV